MSGRQDDGMSTGFKVWMAFCVTVGLSFFGLVGWAIIRLVTHYT